MDKDVGEVIEGVRWIYNSFESWVKEQFQWLSTWQFRQSMKKLRDLGIVKVIRYKAKQWNQTNYYTLDYERLSEFMKQGAAESTEISDLCATTDRDVNIPHLEVKDSHKSYIETKITSPEKTTKQVAAAFLKKDEIEEIISEEGNHRETTSKPLTDDLNPKQKTNTKSNNKKKSPSPCSTKKYKHNSQSAETKINNQQWRSHLNELDQLGVKINQTIINAVKFQKTEKVEGALALLKARKRDKYISNPAGYFIQALKEDWARNVVTQDNPEDKAIFRYWYDLARELGYCQGQEVRDGEQWVCLTGTWEKWEDAWKRGYTLEYLKKVKSR